MNACQHCGREHPPGAPKCPATGESMQSPGLVGTRVDRYQLGKLLGSGGFGSVYLATHVHTDSTVALKLLKRSLGADQQMLERFLREARAAASVGSEHIVRVMDAGLSTDGQAFLALEFLDGLDLKELNTQQGPLAPLRLVMVVLQALDALSAAHAKGIVHRDMKPANVFVVRRRDERGVERDFVKLLDFGISKMHGDAATSGLTMTGVAMGTPSYMAPEQFFDARSVDARADLYSVSAMLYELLSGRLPFDAESYAHLIVKVRTEQAPPLNQIAPNVPLPLAQVVMVGLAKEPQQRWQSAREFADALRSALGLPQAGSTPAFLPSQSGAAFQPVPVEGLEKTHTPQPATPAAWVVPSSGSANTGLPLAVTPPPPQPQQNGWVVAPQATQPPVAPPQPAKSSGLKWVLIVLGVLFMAGGCCTCGVIASAAAADDDEVAQPTPAPSVTPVEVAPEDEPEPDVIEPADEPEPAPVVEEEVAPPPPPRRPRHKGN
ncbi:MAG: serine/threonine-protein kinase [Archangium sp.]|nr:serine/threonine-protein kinase [Archangium sp.]